MMIEIGPELAGLLGRFASPALAELVKTLGAYAFVAVVAVAALKHQLKG